MAAPLDPFTIPRNLLNAARQEGRQRWLATLPATAARLADRWSLTVGAPFQPGGQTAWVAPVRGSSGADAVLKIAWPHTEALHEADGLRVWAGMGTVRLLASEVIDDAVALLLEACRPGTGLGRRPEEEQDAVICGLLRRLWVAPERGHPFRPLQTMCDEWATEFDAKVAQRGTPLDPGLRREGLRLWRTLPTSADRSVLLCTDLHAENVLAAEREPWLAIDPKPYVGDPAYDPLQHIINCDRRLHEDPRGLSDLMADLLDLDRERLAHWLFARCVIESPSWPQLGDIAVRMAPR
jgi:streptomycin 6-kinase